jgi:hypothetical protein
MVTKSGRRSARIPLELARPRQNSRASRIFDLPDPLGPETTVNPPVGESCRAAKGFEVGEFHSLDMHHRRWVFWVLLSGTDVQRNNSQQGNTGVIGEERWIKPY